MAAKSSSRNGCRITTICVHTNEGNNPLGPGPDRTAENLAAWMDRECAAGRGKSYHKIVDDDSVVHHVPDDQAAWALLSGNPRSLNLCFTGWAAWSRAEWLAHRGMLQRGAGEVGIWCRRYGIPVRHLTVSQVAADASGIIGHVDWTYGKRDGNHTDPGPNFPWDVFLAMVGEVPSLRTSRKGESVQLPRTLPAGDGKPGPSWEAREEIIAASSPIVAVFGHRGAWIQEAWWGPSGTHVVEVKAARPVEQFEVQRWTPPAGSEFFVIRYAAPSGGSIGLA